MPPLLGAVKYKTYRNQNKSYHDRRVEAPAPPAKPSSMALMTS